MKKRVLCSRLPEPNRSVILPESEARHVQRVLRLSQGDLVEVLDGAGHHAWGRLSFGGAGVQVEYVGPAPEISGGASEPMVPVVLEIAVLKGDAMEWVIEKATELGIRSVQPILTDHTVIQIKNKGPSFFQERWQKIADQALKQCGRLDRLKVETPVALEDLLLRKPAVDAWIRFWCDEQQRNGGRGTLADWILAPGSEFPPDVKIMIGPEGGWSPQERVILKKYCDDLPGRVISVGLGPLVLRAETAAIFAMSLTSAFIRAGLS